MNEDRKIGVEEEDKVPKKEITDLTEEDIPTQMFEGERIDVEDVLGENIVIRDMDTRPSSFSEGDYAILQIEKDGEPYKISTGATVVMKQIQDLEDKLPFRCKVIKKQSKKSGYKYYILAPPSPDGKLEQRGRKEHKSEYRPTEKIQGIKDITEFDLTKTAKYMEDTDRLRGYSGPYNKKYMRKGHF